MLQNDLKQTTARRRFLGTLAKGAAALGFMSLASPLRLNAEPVLPTENMNESDSWFNKIKGKHKIVYDATNAHEAMPLAWSWVFLNTNNETGTMDNDLGVVVILRHEAIPLAMKDAMWPKYNFGKVFKLNDPKTKAESTRNYFWNSQEGDLMITDWSIDRLQKRGVQFCVCNMAITVFSGIVGKEMGLKPEDVKKDWLANLQPGIQVVPSGVWAVNRAQEHGCSYCFAG